MSVLAHIKDQLIKTQTYTSVVSSSVFEGCRFQQVRFENLVEGCLFRNCAFEQCQWVAGARNSTFLCCVFLGARWVSGHHTSRLTFSECSGEELLFTEGRSSHLSLTKCQFTQFGLCRMPSVQDLFIEECSLQRSSFEGSVIIAGTLTGGEIRCSMDSSRWTRANWTDVDARDCTLTHAVIAGLTSTRCSLARLVALHSNWSSCHIIETNLSQSRFPHSTFSYVQFDRTNLNGGALPHSQLEHVTFNEASLRRTSITESQISHCKFVNVDESALCLRNTTLLNVYRSDKPPIHAVVLHAHRRLREDLLMNLSDHSFQVSTIDPRDHQVVHSDSVYKRGTLTWTTDARPSFTRNLQRLQVCESKSGFFVGSSWSTKPRCFEILSHLTLGNELFLPAAHIGPGVFERIRPAPHVPRPHSR